MMRTAIRLEISKLEIASIKSIYGGLYHVNRRLSKAGFDLEKEIVVTENFDNDSFVYKQITQK